MTATNPKKPIVEVLERQSYDVIKITFSNGDRLSIQTSHKENMIDINLSAYGDSKLIVRPGMSNVVQIYSSEIK